MVDRLEQEERYGPDLTIVERTRFNQTIEPYRTKEVPVNIGVNPHTVKELPALPVRERQQDNMLQQPNNMLQDEEVVHFGQRVQQPQHQQQLQLQLQQHNIPHNPVYPKHSDAMKQTVEMVEDEEVLQTTTCTPKDIDKDPEGWKLAFKAELDSLERLDVMDSVPLNSLDTTSVEILPCKVVMVKKPLGDGTHKKKGRVVVCGNFQQIPNTPSFPMLRTFISLAALYRWAVESWDVSTAFLYAPLIEKRDVYCKPPQVLVKLGLDGEEGEEGEQQGAEEERKRRRRMRSWK